MKEEQETQLPASAGARIVGAICVLAYVLACAIAVLGRG
jgi:hypothetical protein